MHSHKNPHPPIPNFLPPDRIDQCQSVMYNVRTSNGGIKRKRRLSISVTMNTDRSSITRQVGTAGSERDTVTKFLGRNFESYKTINDIMYVYIHTHIHRPAGGIPADDAQFGGIKCITLAHVHSRVSRPANCMCRVQVVGPIKSMP